MKHYLPTSLIVTFIGPVGVGKSTQMLLLKKFLRKRGIHVVTTFIKSSHGFSFILSEFLSVLGIHRIECGRDTLTDSQKSVIRRLLPLWQYLDTFSIASKFLFTVFLPYRLGFTVLLEEGPAMTMFTYQASFPLFFDVDPSVPVFVPRLSKFVARSNHLDVLLVAEEKDLLARRKSRAFRQTESKKYVILQNEWIAKVNNETSVKIDTSNISKEKVHRAIVDAVSNHIRQIEYDFK